MACFSAKIVSNYDMDLSTLKFHRSHGESLYDQLVSAGARDDGIVFYAPINGDVQVMTAGIGNSTLYFSSAGEVAARSGAQPTPVFKVLSQPSADTRAACAA